MGLLCSLMVINKRPFECLKWYNCRINNIWYICSKYKKTSIDNIQ